MIAHYVDCWVHLKHVPRKSSIASTLADALTRTTSTTEQVQAMLVHAQLPAPPSILVQWLNHPREDWYFALDLVPGTLCLICVPRNK